MSPDKFILYSIITSTISLFIFFYGFFPVPCNTKNFADSNEIPLQILDQKLNLNSYSPVIGRVIFMVIDALRSDFVYDLNKYMPNLNSIIQSNISCACISEATSPTVTLPRIKALTTGYIPAYIDVVLNFGSQVLHADNILHQAHVAGKNIVFYGDDTWIKLFPNTFKRYDGTTSFYVSDFYEVDFNVTRNLNTELQKTDWSFMVLHYLGLDHIGHVEGPRGKHIKPKLKEMDDIIQNIYTTFIERKSSHENPPLLIICGDHGMRDSGGHGGSSKGETEVPLIFIGDVCTNTRTDSRIHWVQQIDLAATLAVLWGLPIPAGSIGSILDPAMFNLSIEQKLHALYYNAMHLVKKCMKSLENFQDRAYYADYLKAKHLYSEWLSNNRTNSSIASRSAALFVTSANQMSRDLSSLATQYDEFYLVLSIILMAEALVVLVCFGNASCAADFSKALCKNILLLFTLKFTVLTIIKMSSEQQIFSVPLISLNVIIATILTMNHYFMKNIKISNIQLVNHHLETYFMFFGILIHAISLSSTSFIEEEHMTYYHLSSSFIILLIFRDIRKLITNYEKRSELFNDMNDFISFLRLLGCAVILRFLRHLNSTGDKYQNMYDVADWLNESEHKTESTIFYIIVLSGVYCTILQYLDIQIVVKHIPLFIVFFTIYQYKSTTNNLHMITFDSIFAKYILIFIFLVSLLIVLLKINSTKRASKIRLFFVLFLLYCTFLIKPCNAVLIPSAVYIINRVLNYKCNDVRFIYVGLIWVGSAFYFFQGNSNSLASVDVSAGYTGLSFYNPVLVGLQIAIHTNIGPLLVIFAILTYRNSQISHLATCLSLCRLVPLTWYLVMVYFQRTHLFAWTVFAPKLMFETSHTVLNSVVILFLYIIPKKTW